MLAWISVCQPINADLNTGSPHTILQGVDPLAIGLGFLNRHYFYCILCTTSVKENMRKIRGLLYEVEPRV